MKGAMLVAEDPAVFEDVRRILLAHGADAGAVGVHEYVQVRDDRDRLLMAYSYPPELAADYRDGSFTLGSGPAIPDMSRMTGVMIECRWEDLFVNTVALLALELTYRCWVLDGSDVIWAGEALDPERIRL